MNQKKPVILIVDDDPYNLSLLYDMLDAKNYDVRVESDGQNALEIVKNEKPDLVLLDVMMPGMNGFEVCTKLKAAKETKSIPVIFITALTEMVNKVRGLELGAFDYITKPFQIEVVLSQIRNCLRLCSKEREYHRLRSDLEKISESDLRSPLYMISSTVRRLSVFSQNMPAAQLEKRLETMLGLVDAAKGILEMYEKVLEFGGKISQIPMELTDAPGFFGRIAEEFEVVTGDMATIHFTSNVSECAVETVPALIEHAVWNLLSTPVGPDSKKMSVSFEISVRENILVFKLHNSAGPNTEEAVREAEWLTRAAGGRLSTDKMGNRVHYVLEIPVATGKCA